MKPAATPSPSATAAQAGRLKTGATLKTGRLHVHFPAMEAVVAVSFPLASIVIVLFLLWNDLLRRRRTSRAPLFVRAFLCVALGAVLIYNWVTFRRLQDLPVTFVLIAAIIAFVASVWFVYRGIGGDRGFISSAEEEPLPKIFVSRSEEQTEDERRRDHDE
ncbi:MAG: hypothetical protein KY432_10120 [Acidobacteria bacterium]|nr:hypothetical protein [Acidobacteriota bacterium]